MFRGPTQARPGSEEKIRVMEHRYETGQPIFHKDDAQVRLDRMDGGYGGPVATMPKSKPSCEQMPEAGETDFADDDLDIDLE